MDLGRKLILHGLVVGLLASFVVACGGDSPVIGEDVSGSPGDVSTVDVPSAETAGVPETVALSGTVIAATSLAPLSNASVCIEATCVASDSDGGFVLEVPPGTVTLQVEASGYRTAATVVDTSTDPWVTVPMVSEQLWSEQQIGAGLNGATGILARFVTTDGEGGAVPLAGVTVQLAGYAGMGSLYQLGGLAGPGGATGADGQGLFIDVSAGSYTIVSSHPGGACMPSYGTMDGGLTVVALADVVTVVSFQCVVVESDRVGLSGAVTSHQTGASMMAVEVCFHPADQQEATCTYTGPDGTYGFNDLPPDAAGTLMVTAAGFYPSRTPLNTGSGRVVPVVVSAAGVPRMTVAEPFDPAEQGIAVMTAYDNVSVVDGDLASSTLLAGVSLGLKPGAGLGPYYLAEPGLYSPIAPATFDAGEGVILNLPVGTYAAAFEHPWGNCWPGNGLAYEADGAFTFEVEAGVETRLVALCDAAVPETATIIGRFVNGLSLPDPLEGGTVCLVEKNTTTGEYEESMCATADENGDYELSGVPANTEIRLRSTSPGYDINDYILNSHFGLTHESRLTPSVMKQYIWNPIVEAGKCEDVEDINTYGGKAFFTTRIYDAAYNSDTFYQGLWTWRGKVHVEPLDGPDDSSMTMLYFDDYLVNTELDESTHSNGGVMTCAIEPGFYRIRYTHPWGECQIGYGNLAEADGSFVIELLVSNMVSSGGSCTLDPPGTLVEELESYPPVASARLALESTGLLEALVPALPAEVLYQRERVTVLAPTDAAFSTFFLASGQQDADALDEVMRHHLIEGELEVHELVRDAPHWTMAGKPIRFVEDPDGTIRIDGTNARIVEAEHWALDGNIYVIDEVLPVPETPPSTMETVAVSSASAEEIGGVQLDHETWDGKLVGYPKFNVYTPPGYYADLPAGYPVVYLLHDVGGDHLSLFGGPTMGQTPTTGLHQVVETLVNSANIPPMILVSINGLSQGYGSYFVGESSETSSPTFGAFGSYVAEIVTQVESTYNTATAPDSSENRALLGVGMGGFGAIHLASSHPVFSAVVVHSGLLSVADLLESDAVVASTYPDGEVDGSLWSEVMYAWKEAYGTELLDGRLTELVGPGQPAISRMVSMATAFSPMEAFFLEFDQAGTTTAGAAAGRVTDIDGDATNNHDYPVVAVDTNLTAEVIDDQYIGYRLPWSSDGTLDEAVWAQWAAYEPLAALEGAAEALQDADTDFYLDCGTENERGLVDQIEGFVQSASAAVGDEQMNLEIYQGDHAGQVYTERFYASMLWLGGILVEEAAAP